MAKNGTGKEHLVIVGGGFGGLYMAKALGNSDFKVTLIDKRNFHLFQPLLYQVATGLLSPGDIASPLRGVLGRYKNITVLNAEVTDVDPETQMITLADGKLAYDYLIVATGVSHYYFGKSDIWADKAPGLKTLEDAIEIRRRVLLAFEVAERETDPEKRRAWLTFVVVGAGPTGVELAGALGELANITLRGDFRHIDPTEAKILLVEGTGRVLPPYPEELSEKAAKSLQKLGVTIRPNTFVTDIRDDGVTVKTDGEEEDIATHTVLWGAGMKASALGTALAERANAETDRVGRVIVNQNLTVGDYENIFVLGDLANFSHQGDSPLPGVAQVAMQQGEYLAKMLKKHNDPNKIKPFRYKDRGSLAVIGRNSAVADVGKMRFSGFPAWLIWVFVHIAYLIEFDNRLIVMMQWGMNYFTRKRGTRLITGKNPFPKITRS